MMIKVVDVEAIQIRRNENMIKGDNPLNIPFDNIDEKEGTLEFRSTKGNLMDTSIKNVLFFDVQVGESKFALHRDENFDIIFTHWNTRTGIRVAKVNSREFNDEGRLFIALTWSEKENYLYVGKESGLHLKSSKAEQKCGAIRMGTNEVLYQISKSNEGICQKEICKK